MNLNESTHRSSSGWKVTSNGGSHRSYQVPIQSSFTSENSSQDQPPLSQISSYQKSKTFVENHNSSYDDGNRNFISDLRTQNRLTKDNSQSIPVESYSAGARSGIVEDTVRMSVTPVENVERTKSFTKSEEGKQDSNREEKTVTIKRKITRRKKGTETVNTLRDSYIERIASPLPGFDSASETDESVQVAARPAQKSDVVEIVPLKHAMVNERAPTIIVSEPSMVQEEFILPQKKPEVASGRLLDFLNNPVSQKKPSTGEISRETVVNRFQEAPVSSYSARKENMKSQQMVDDKTLGARASQAEGKIGRRNETTEEIETISLQPIGRGVQDLAIQQGATLSRPGSRAATPRNFDTGAGTIRSTYYQEESKQIGGYNSAPLMPKFAKSNSVRNVSLSNTYGLSGSEHRLANEPFPMTTSNRASNLQTHRSTFSRSPRQTFLQETYIREPQEQTSNVSFNRAANEQTQRSTFSRSPRPPFFQETYNNREAHDHVASSYSNRAENEQTQRSTFRMSPMPPFLQETYNRDAATASFNRVSPQPIVQGSYSRAATASFNGSADEQSASRSFYRASNEQPIGTITNRGANNETVNASWYTRTENFGVGNRAYQTQMLSSSTNQGNVIIPLTEDQHQYTLQMIVNSEEQWYQPHLSRDDVINYLSGKESGSFFIRTSSTFENAYGLAMKVDSLPMNAVRSNDYQSDLVRHYLIESVDDGSSTGVRLKGFETESVYPSLAHFVHAHCQNAGALPNRLVLPQSRYMASVDQMDTATIKSNYLNDNQNHQEVMGTVKAPLLSQSYRSLSSPGTKFTNHQHSNPLHQYYKTNLMYLGKVEIDRLKGHEAIEHAVDKIINKPNLKTTTVEIQLDSTKGITLNDKLQKIFYTRQIPAQHIILAAFDRKEREFTSSVLQNNGINRGRIIGILVKKQKIILRENVVHLFCEMDKSNNVNDIIDFVSGNYGRML